MKDLKNIKMKSQKGDEFNVSFVIGKELHDKLKNLLINMIYASQK